MRQLFISFIVLFVQPVLACTVFVLTDGEQALFFNNEDYTNPNTRIWFIPEGENYYGCVFVGYDDGSAQGGLNTQGLAFDWYAGKPEEYEPSSDLIPIADNSSERMLEQCATVEEAVQFYQTYAEPSFGAASILIADKTGASVIIGARDAKIYVERSAESQVIGGQGKRTFERLYSDQTSVSLESGSDILRQCVAKGEGGTLYSNAYNLKTGDIYVFNFSDGNTATKLNIHDELDKGSHYYTIPNIKSEINQPEKPLEINMLRLILFDFTPLENKEPEVSSTVESIFTEGAAGNLKAEHFSDSLWQELEPIQEQLSQELTRLGKMKSIHLINREKIRNGEKLNYIVIFEYVRILQEVSLNSDREITNLETQSSYVTDIALEGSRTNFHYQNILYAVAMPLGIVLVLFFSFRFLRNRSRLTRPTDM